MAPECQPKRRANGTLKTPSGCIAVGLKCPGQRHIRKPFAKTLCWLDNCRICWPVVYTGVHTLFDSESESAVETEEFESDVQSEESESESPVQSGMYSEQISSDYEFDDTDMAYQATLWYTEADYQDGWVYDYVYGQWYYCWLN